jgi:hypothetical protein
LIVDWEVLERRWAYDSTVILSWRYLFAIFAAAAVVANGCKIQMTAVKDSSANRR